MGGSLNKGHYGSQTIDAQKFLCNFMTLRPYACSSTRYNLLVANTNSLSR